MHTCKPKFGQPGDVRIDRTSKWGNPHPLLHEFDRDQVIAAYERYLRNNPELLDALSELKDAKRLGCHCYPKKCHGEVIVKVMKEKGLI